MSVKEWAKAAGQQLTGLSGDKLTGDVFDIPDPWDFFYKYLEGPTPSQISNFVLHAGAIQTGAVTSFLSSVYFQGVVAEKEVEHAIAGVNSGLLKQVMPAEIDIVLTGKAMSYLLQPNLEGIPLFASKMQVMRQADTPSGMVITYGNQKQADQAWVRDNISSRPRVWNIVANLQSMDLFIDSLGGKVKASIVMQAELLDVMVQSRRHCWFKTYDNTFHRVIVESLEVSYKPGEVNTAEVSLTLREYNPYVGVYFQASSNELLAVQKKMGQLSLLCATGSMEFKVEACIQKPEPEYIHEQQITYAPGSGGITYNRWSRRVVPTEYYVIHGLPGQPDRLPDDDRFFFDENGVIPARPITDLTDGRGQRRPGDRYIFKVNTLEEANAYVDMWRERFYPAFREDGRGERYNWVLDSNMTEYNKFKDRPNSDFITKYTIRDASTSGTTEYWLADTIVLPEDQAPPGLYPGAVPGPGPSPAP